MTELNETQRGLKSASERFSKFLAGSGVSSLQVVINREAVSYESDIANAFALFDNTYTIQSGSMSDGAGLYYGYGTANQSSDSDCVTIYKPLPVTDIDDIENLEDACVVKIPDKDNLGYARLLVKNPEYLDMSLNITQLCLKGPDGQQYLSSKLMVKCFETVIYDASSEAPFDAHGPALNIDLPPEVVADLLGSDEDRNIDIDKPSFRSKSETGVDQTDLVICLESKQWPAEAESFKTRERKSGWPNKELVETIIKSGCIFAPVGHKQSIYKDYQWRISFNKAESLLVKSFSETQMQCYVLLKIFCNEILKKVSDKNITSYIIKSTMFWVSESLSPDKWRPEELISCFLACINQLKKWLSENLYMPNFFIEGRNMFLRSEFTESAVRNTIKALDDVSDDPVNILGQMALLEGIITKPPDELDFDIPFMDIVYWIRCRVQMAEKYYFSANKILQEAYHRRDTLLSIKRCESVLIELKKVGGYAKPVIQLVENCLGVLHYDRALKESNEDLQRQEKSTALAYLEKSKDVEYFHAPLRMITCLMSDNTDSALTEQMLKTAIGAYKRVNPISKRGYKDTAKRLLNVCLSQLQSIRESRDLDILQKLHAIVKKDILDRDAQATSDSLKMLPEAEAFHFALTGPWKEIFCLRVVFMAAEIDILPRPLQLEARMQILGKSLNEFGLPEYRGSSIESPTASFHPQIYSTFMAFLFYFKNGMHLRECSLYLRYLEKATEEAAETSQVVGYNLITYAKVKMCAYRSATANLMKSLSLQSDHDNVAFEYLVKVYRELQRSVYQNKTVKNEADSEVVKVIYDRSKRVKEEKLVKELYEEDLKIEYNDSDTDDFHEERETDKRFFYDCASFAS